MNAPHGFWKWLCCLILLLEACVRLALAHTLPISYLRLTTDESYLHLELIFNPFELTFLSELDDNHDAELSPAELSVHGQLLADRVVGAFKLTAGGKTFTAETAGMDPDLNGHHVRLRAHYRLVARNAPLTLASDFNQLTSGSHLTQISYVNGTNTQMAQFDSQSHSVTFESRDAKVTSVLPNDTVKSRALLVPALVLAVLLVLAAAAISFSFVHKQRRNPQPVRES